METETLSQLIALFAQLGGEAKWAFIVYIAFRAFVVVAIAGTVLLLAWWIIRAFYESDRDAATIRTLGELFGISYYSREKILAAVSAMKAASEK